MLNSKQIITTEDLLDWSVVPFSPTQAYVVGNTIKDPTTGEVYKCIANAAANTPLTDLTYFETVGTYVPPTATMTPLTGYVTGVDLIDPITGLIYTTVGSVAIGSLTTKAACSAWLSNPANATPSTASSATPLSTATDAQALAKASSAVAITPANLAALTASSADAITGTDTNKFLTAKSLADTLQNPATVGTNTKYGTLKTASAASAQAGTATDEALTSSNIPDITASDAEAQAETITNKFLTPKNLAAMQATDVEAKAMTELKKFLTPKNLDALRAVLADISDTAPLNDKFMTDKHLVDWFTAVGRKDLGGGAYVVQKLPGGLIMQVFSAVINNAGGAGLNITSFPVSFPTGCAGYTMLGLTSALFGWGLAEVSAVSSTSAGFTWVSYKNGAINSAAGSTTYMVIAIGY